LVSVHGCGRSVNFRIVVLGSSVVTSYDDGPPSCPEH
jgi:hypothetical protein